MLTNPRCLSLILSGLRDTLACLLQFLSFLPQRMPDGIFGIQGPGLTAHALMPGRKHTLLYFVRETSRPYWGQLLLLP